MKVLLNGGVAQRGMKILPERFGDRISLRQISPDDDAETVAENMAWAEFMISRNYDAEMRPGRARGAPGAPRCAARAASWS